MKHCPNPECPGAPTAGGPVEYRDDTERCADCGDLLVDGPAPLREQDERFAVQPHSGRLVGIAICRRPGETQRVQAILSSEGISSFVQGEHASGIAGGVLAARVLVAEDEAGRASELLSAEPLVEELAHVVVEPEADGGPFVTRAWAYSLFVIMLIVLYLALQRGSS